MGTGLIIAISLFVAVIAFLLGTLYGLNHGEKRS